LRSAWSNHIGKRLFGSSEVPDTRRYEHDYINYRECKTWQVNTILYTYKAPSKAIDDPNHWVECIEKPKLRWNDATLKAYWGHIESKLDHERDNESEVAVFHHEGGNPHTYPE
jgi:hypothetical protein